MALVLIAAIFTLVSLSCSTGKTEQKVVYITQIANSETMLTKLKNHEIDGFLMWEPYSQEAVLKKYGEMLQTSREIWPNHPDCVIAVSDQRVDRSTVQAFLWAHIKATRFINNPSNQQKVIKYAMDFTKKDRAITEAALDNIKWEEFPDEKEFENYYRELTKSPILTKKITDLGYASEHDFFKDFLDRKEYEFIKSKLDKDPNWRPAPVKSEKVIHFGRIVPGIFHLATYVAEKEGFYQEVGLVPGKNLEIQGYPHGVAIMQKFGSGELDIAYVGVAPATLKRINDGVDVRIIGGVEGQDSGLVVRNDRGIKSVAGLEGKTVAVPAIGNVQYVILEKAIRKAGLKPVVR
ncbi:MAG: ABC transporter substrate-binding protein [Eubacteriales bacterium]